jgi:hypothetical protein
MIGEYVGTRVTCDIVYLCVYNFSFFPLKRDGCVIVRPSFGEVSGRGKAYTGFWCGNLRERDNLKDEGVN